jgi:hypothetical protein
MAEVTIRFRYNRATGRRELIVGYESDDDLLPHEHERDHRALVEALIGQPVGADTDVLVERVRKDGTVIDAPPAEAPAGREAVREKG